MTRNSFDIRRDIEALPPAADWAEAVARYRAAERGSLEERAAYWDMTRIKLDEFMRNLRGAA